MTSVKITPMTYEVNPINDAYEFPYKEGVIGDTTTAEEILSIYCDEPDWGPDQNLNISWQQKFMGGYEGTASRGYLHCHYPAGSFNIPVPAMPMGIARDLAGSYAPMLTISALIPLALAVVALMARRPRKAVAIAGQALARSPRERT